MGRRLLLVLFAAAVCVTLILLLRPKPTPPRAPSRPGLLDGETLRDLPRETVEEGPSREPALLSGHVYRPDGTPADKAEVRVVLPRTYVLVRSAENGVFEMRFERSGRYLVEAALTTECASERAWVEVPEQGDPEPLDFRLKAAGAIFGEVTVLGMPVGDAGVELYAIDLYGDADLVHDTSARNGYFNFYFAPPRDVPLRLDVKSDEGILRTPLSFRWMGEQMDLGRIDLTPYPSLRIRMRLPDGRYAKEVLTTRREDLIVRGGVWCVPAQPLGRRSRVAFPQENDVTMQLVFTSDSEAEEKSGQLFMVEREVELAFGRPRELELVVRPGPLVVTSRLLDGNGRPLHARIAVGDREVATREDGSFQLAVPCGGLTTARLAALDVPSVGWVDLFPDSPEHRFLIDADAPAECRLDLGRRVIVVGAALVQVSLEGPERWCRTVGAYGELSWPLPEGEYRWTRATITRDADGTETVDPESRAAFVTVAEGKLAVIDAR